ncbi:NAD(P)-binding domain-containing protein [Synechococcus sp. CBW1108]|uniref:NAD(P)-binding domain-containing protein n=1 Tax=Synechococcus sp. CBW1108 TaxID=1353147 RepID=UPI001E2F5254|nr:NAD(P)-binding domain-containing protein [Synechococcus sp. CBW1108]
MLGDGPIPAEVLLNQAGTALPGRLVLQMATIAPAESRDLAIALQQRSARYLGTPVLGSRPISNGPGRCSWPSEANRAISDMSELPCTPSWPSTS